MGIGDGLYMYVVVVQKFTFAISSPDEFLSPFFSKSTFPWLLSLFLSTWLNDRVSDAYNIIFHITLFTILFFNSMLKLLVISFFLFINAV